MSMTKAGSIPSAPPRREGEQQGCDGDFNKQLCHRKSQKGRLFQKLTRSRIGQSTGAFVVLFELSTAPCQRASFVHSCVFMCNLVTCRPLVLRETK